MRAFGGGDNYYAAVSKYCLDSSRLGLGSLIAWWVCILSAFFIATFTGLGDPNFGVPTGSKWLPLKCYFLATLDLLLIDESATAAKVGSELWCRS